MPGGRRKLPPDSMLLDVFASSSDNVELAIRYGVTPQAIRDKRKKLMGPPPDGSPAKEVRKYPKADQHKTVRPAEIPFRFHTIHTFISLARVPSVDGHYDGA